MNQAHLQYKRGCVLRIRYIFSTSEDVQYESGTSSVQARMCSTRIYEQGTSSVKNVLLHDLMTAFAKFLKHWLSLIRYSTLKSSSFMCY